MKKFQIISNFLCVLNLRINEKNKSHANFLLIIKQTRIIIFCFLTNQMIVLKNKGKFKQ